MIQPGLSYNPTIMISFTICLESKALKPHIIKKMETVLMKRRKSIKQKLNEVTYERPSLGKKLTTLQKSVQEVNGILNSKK